MKKALIISAMLIMIIVLATSSFASTKTLVDEIYTKGSAYGVTESHKKQMEEYFTNNPVTEEQEKYILSKVDECIAIMDNSGTKDVTKLSETNLNEVKSKVQDAASKIGLTVNYSENSFSVAKNGKTVGEYLVKSGSNTATTSAKKFVYTGSNLTLGIASLTVIIIAIASVVKLRKNA